MSTHDSAKGVAHAKAILFGEHAVVYGAPAIALPVPQLEAEARIDSNAEMLQLDCELFRGAAAAAPAQLRPVVTAILAALAHTRWRGQNPYQLPLRVHIVSTIPHLRGLGSSAAVAAAIGRAIAGWGNVPLSSTQLYEIVQQAERIAHGNPSGIDAQAVAADGVIRFEAGKVSRLHLGASLHLVCADSGVAGATAEAVQRVRQRRAVETTAFTRKFSMLAELTEASVHDLAVGNVQALGQKMREAHAILDRIGVSTTGLNQLVAAAVDAGAAGAKLTGAGLGGCVIALVESPVQAEHVGARMRAAGAPRTWTAMVPAT